MCNISLSLPGAPLLTQPREAEARAFDVDAGVPVCRGDGRPAACPPHRHGADEQSCECTHVIRVPLGSAVELVLADQGEHPHLSNTEMCRETRCNVVVLSDFERLN